MYYEEAECYSNNLLNALPDGILTIFPDGKVVHINIEAQSELHVNASASEKYQKEELYISDLFHLLHEERDILPEILEKLRNGERELELLPNTCIQEKITNTIFPVKGQFFVFELDENVAEIIFYFHNITRELTQEYILNTALMRTRIYSWFFDIDRSVFVLDPRYFEYLGITPGPHNTLTMEEYTNMVHPDDWKALSDAFAVQFSGNVVYDKPVPFRIRRGNGTWEWFEGQSTYIGKLSGLPYRLVGICMSIQEHKNIEETLIAARMKAEESDRLKSAFLANMSHEIRTPLNAIVGFSEVLSTTFEELNQQERDDYVSLIKKNSAQLLVLISDILDLARIESNTMEFVARTYVLNDLLEEIYRFYKMKELPDVALKFQLPEEKVFIHTDATRLKQVMNNLIDNAIKFTSKGTIRFGFGKNEGQNVELFVEDTGEGISEENLEHIFERFYKIDSFKQGTGLGLSICKTIIENLNGSITVDSKVNEGTCFRITLPLNMQIPHPSAS